MATLYSPKIVTDGLVIALDAANVKSYPGSGTTWIDLTGNGRNSTLTNGPTFGNTTVGNITFDGTNDYASLPGTLTSTVLGWTPLGSVGLSTMTIEMWFKTSDTSGYLYSKPWNGSGGYNITIDTTQIVIGPIHLNYANTSGLVFNPTLSDGKYHQLVCWLNPTSFGYYIDGGVNVGSKNHGFTSDNPTGLGTNTNENGVIMSLYPYGQGWAGNTGMSTNGEISIFKIYNKILSTTDVLQNFNATRGRFGL
jgi:hypothetical protein